MAQVILKVFSLFCSLGGPNIVPFFLPLINPMTLISSFIPIMLIVMLGTGINALNSSDDGKEKNWSKGSAWAFLIYYLIVFISACSVMQTTCRVGQSTGFV